MRLSAILVVLCAAAYIDALKITDPPAHVSALVGGSVTLRCGLDGALGEEILTWKSYTKESVGDKIYYSKIGVIAADKSKYKVSDTYSLTIEGLTIADGGYYGCELGSSNSEKANVIVISEPMISIDPSSETLDVGQTVTVRCTSQFGSPLVGDMPEAPTMSLWIGGSLAKDNKVMRGKQRGEKSTLSSSGNYTATSGDRNIEITCRVNSIPYFTAETKDKLVVKYPVKDIDYVPNKNELFVGETLNCTADANPPPTFIWFPKNSPGGRRTEGSVLKITQQMIGDNTWECTATDTRGNSIKKEAKFNVVAAPNNPDGKDPEASLSGPPTVTVVLAVVIPIVIICIIAIVVILYMRKRRRERESSEEMKSAHHHPNGDSGYDEQAPREAPVTPNPSGYPVYPGPYPPEGGSQTDMPQTYPGRNSPGYADLGIRHLGQTNPGVDTNVTASPDPIAPNRGYSNEVYDQSPRQQESVLSTGPDPGSVV